MTEPSLSIVFRKIKLRLTKLYIYSILTLVFGLVISGYLSTSVLAGVKNSFVMGGPEDSLVELNNTSSNQDTILRAVSPLGDVFGEEYSNIFVEDDIPELYIVKSATLLNSVAVSGDSLTKHNGDILSYTIQEGDNLSKIATQFGISLNTIIWANGVTKNSQLKKGEELTILPVSGVVYEAKPGDTIESISASFGVSSPVIIKTNDIENPNEIAPGIKLIIPNGKPLRSLSAIAKESQNNLPSLLGFFTRPVPSSSLNWGVLHSSNAVDFANVCGTKILASASGMVIKTGSPNLWNGGYGGYVLLEHQNGTETLYAHTQENLVDIGSYVEQSDVIAKIGKTGRATGCHVHFEVHGARNPFVK